ncbi:MAG: epoxyqueuosine reductase [Clostridia bacterium]|nr:epoxyqueuosine reductase [Clostridia bacterium]
MNWLEFKKAAEDVGFMSVGQCSPDSFNHSKRIVESQPPLSERRQLRYLPREEMPWIRSIAVLLFPYMPATVQNDNTVFIDSYYQASNNAYHAAISLENIAKSAGRMIKANVSYPAKEAAVRAALGAIGKNGLLITEQYGTRVVIILMATDFAPEGEDAPYTGISCLDCGACIRACPAAALDQHGMSHPERCLRNFMMEGVVMPEHLREKNGARLIGCDVCQRVCPMQKEKVTVSKSVDFCTDDFVTQDQAAFSDSVQRLANMIGRNAARPQRIRAQAALIAGNSGNPAYLPILRDWSESPFEAVRVHASWAVERLSAVKHD